MLIYFLYIKIRDSIIRPIPIPTPIGVWFLSLNKINNNPTIEIIAQVKIDGFFLEVIDKITDSGVKEIIKDLMNIKWK